MHTKNKMQVDMTLHMNLFDVTCVCVFAFAFALQRSNYQIYKKMYGCVFGLLNVCYTLGVWTEHMQYYRKTVVWFEFSLLVSYQGHATSLHCYFLTLVIPSCLWSAQNRGLFPSKPKLGYLIHSSTSHRGMTTLTIPSCLCLCMTQNCAFAPGKPKQGRVLHPLASHCTWFRFRSARVDMSRVGQPTTSQCVNKYDGKHAYISLFVNLSVRLSVCPFVHLSQISFGLRKTMCARDNTVKGGLLRGTVGSLKRSLLDLNT